MFRASNQYSKIKELGKGTFGQVSLVEDVICPGKFYTVKVINLDEIIKTNNNSDNNEEQQQNGGNEDEEEEDKKQQIIQAADLLRHNEHPNLVKIVSSFKENNLFHLVMENCNSGTLKDVIRALKKKDEELLDEGTICEWTAQIAMALQHLHNKKFLHRQIKPDNVFLMSNKRGVKLGHFGISTSSKNNSSPPEVWEKKPYTFKSEIWALGVLVYELMALEMPFPSAITTNPRVLAKIICSRAARSLPEKFSSELRHFVVNKLLERDPAKRPDMAQVLGDVCIFPKITAMLSLAPNSPIKPSLELQQQDLAKPTAKPRPRHLSLQILPGNVEEDEWRRSFSMSIHEDDEEDDSFDGQVEVYDEDYLAGEDSDGGSNGCYWEKWNAQPAGTMPLKMPAGVQAILTVPTTTANIDTPSILIVCKNGEIIAFSPVDNWTRVDWRCKVDREIAHATYDHVTDDIYVVPNYVEGTGKHEILRTNRALLKPNVQLEAFIQTSSEVKGISLEAVRRLLFACQETFVGIWKILNNSDNGAVLTATINSIPKPSYVAAFFDEPDEDGDTSSSRVKIAISRPFANQVFLLQTKLDQFTENIAQINNKTPPRKIDDIFEGQMIASKMEPDPLALGSVSWPFEVIFDWQGNLFVADSWNKRIQLFDTLTMQAVWASKGCTSNSYRLAVIARHPRTGRPAALVDKGSVSEWYY